MNKQSNLSAVYLPEAARQYTKPTVLRADFGQGTRYVVVGTAYGYLHTTGGDIKTWLSYSGARRAAKNYRAGV